MKKLTSLFTVIFFLLLLLIQLSHAAVVLPKEGTTTNVVIPDSASLKSALSEFRSLSRKEKRERLREVKKEMRAFKASKRQGNEPSTNTILMYVMATDLSFNF